MAVSIYLLEYGDEGEAYQADIENILDSSSITQVVRGDDGSHDYQSNDAVDSIRYGDRIARGIGPERFPIPSRNNLRNPSDHQQDQRRNGDIIE